MGVPITFVTKLAIPLIVAAFSLPGNGPEQASLFRTTLEASDHVLSIANGEGSGATESYDYIIIGAGSAGSVLAKRLTEDGANRVLLLEGGGDPSPLSEVPWFLDYLAEAGMMLDYQSTIQENACRSSNGSCWFPRGKGMGGSSSVNGLVYNRCNPKDYDAWANFTGDPIWSFRSVVDSFRAIETYKGVYADSPGPNHGTDGEIHIGSIPFTPGFEYLEEMLEEYGLPIGDLNSGDFSTGFSKLDHNIKDGLRWGAWHGFLEPILGRENLKVYRYAWATKIHLDETKRAIGISYARHGQNVYVTATKEIILSAGVIDSPKLLMLSGIGPREHLEQHGIETIVDLPAVGTHLQEHLGLQVYPMAIDTTLGILSPVTPENINEFITTATGPLSNLKEWAHIANCYFPSRTHNDPTWPDIHCYINQVLVATPGGGTEQQIVLEIELVLSNQTGTVRLASGNVEDPPLIDPRFLQDPTDVQRYAEGIEYLTDLFLKSKTFQAIGIRWSGNAQRIPECEQFQFPSPEYWRCFVLNRASPALHPTSTCRMGPNRDVAVVDSKLRVFGTTGLRVIDSSVMPFAPNGNTNLPSIMVGEMGARIILNQI